MTPHDDYARVTPYELTFPDEGDAERFARVVEREGEATGVDPGELAGFMSLGEVTAFLRELRGPDEGGEAIHRYAALAHHAFLFHRAGRPLYLLGTRAARALVTGAPAGGDPPAAPFGPAGGPIDLPEPAGYLQLPRHLFWAEPARGAPPESVDGAFWHRTTSGTLSLLLALGVREDRPGLAVAPVAEGPWDHAPRWLDVTVRAGGDDFATTLPGGAIEGLHSLVSSGEALKLFARVWAYVAARPGAVRSREPEESRPKGGPPPSRLPYRRIDRVS